MAKILKISASTVSRALNDHPRISKETKEKVRQLASRLGYYVAPEQTLPGKNEAITVMVPSLDSQMYREIASGVKDYMNENNYQVFVMDTEKNEEQVLNLFKMPGKFGMSGFVHIVSDKNLRDKFYDLPLKNALPVVTVFEPDLETGVSSVIPDMFQGIDKIMTYLKSLNITRIGLLLEDKNKPEDAQIMIALESVMEQSDFLIPRYTSGEKQIIEHALNTLLAENIQAVIVKNIFMALEVSYLVQRSGINIPDDLILIAVDTDYDSGFSGLTNQFSILKIPGYEMGYEAGKILLEQIEHPEADIRISVIPVNFILKGSALRMKN